MNTDRATTIRVLVADDQAMIRVGLRQILDNERDLAVVAEAADRLGATFTVRVPARD
jgi:DNA-binding NarL/FixJ family response regulator